MSGASKVYEIFEEHREFFDKTVPAGIEKHRKGDGKITVTDKNGTPIKGAKININQKSHEFRFGANLFMLDASSRVWYNIIKFKKERQT